MFRASVVISLVVALAAAPITSAHAQRDSSAAPSGAARAHFWPRLLAGAATSLAVHEGAHIATAYALGGHVTFGLDKGRPTIFSGIDDYRYPHKQFLFSAAGLTAQTVLDEAVLDVPHARGSAFERGILAGGLGTTLFYLTIGRVGSVSDVVFMARMHGMTKTQTTLVYGSIAAVQIARIIRSPSYAHFFVSLAPHAAIVGMTVDK